MSMFTPAQGDLVELERELQDVEELRQRIIDSLLSGLQGPRQRHLLCHKLVELNRSIVSIRLTLSEAA